MLSAALFVIALLPSAKEQELSFKTTDGVELHGTFVEPEHAAGSKLKAVLLVPGSGPTDRNGNQPPAIVADTMKQIAENLAARGIASFRFDKRAAHVNAAIWPKDASKLDDFFSFDNFVSDAETALDILRTQPGIDSAHVGMLGHSEGGLITIVVASGLGKGNLPGIALLGTAGRSLDLVLMDQVSAALHQQTTNPDVIKTYVDNLQQSIDFVKKNGRRPENVLPGLQSLFTPGTGKILQSYFTIDPAKTIGGYTGDVLLLQGEMDSQISVTKDFPALKQALANRKAGSLVPVTVPNASHNLKHVGAPTDAGITGPVEPEAWQESLSGPGNSRYLRFEARETRFRRWGPIKLNSGEHGLNPIDEDEGRLIKAP